MITIHHLGMSQSERIIWLCEELGVPYELKLYARDPVTRLAPAEYKALHLSGTAPVISDGDIVLGETGAIFEYIMERYAPGRLRPAVTDANYADYLFWLHFPNGSFVPAGMMRMVMNFAPDAFPDPSGNSLGARFMRGYQILEERVAANTWLAGEDFTAADVMMLFCVTTSRYFIPHDLSDYPAIKAYIKRCAARPAYQKAMKLGDPDMELLLD